MSTQLLHPLPLPARPAGLHNLPAFSSAKPLLRAWRSMRPPPLRTFRPHSARAGPPAMLGALAAGASLALPLSTAALVALNIAQNGPARPVSLDSVLSHEVSPTFDGPTKFAWKGDGGLLTSSAFTPTDTAPECLNDVCCSPLSTATSIPEALTLDLCPTSVPGTRSADQGRRRPRVAQRLAARTAGAERARAF